MIESFSTTETRLHRCKATQRFTQDNLLLPVASGEPQDYFRRMLSQQQDEREEGHKEECPGEAQRPRGTVDRASVLTRPRGIYHILLTRVNWLLLEFCCCKINS